MGDRNSELFESIKQNPDDASSIEALESGLTEAADWSGLVELYAHLGENASQSADQAAYLRKAAAIEEVRLENPVRAIEFLHGSLGGDDDAVLDTLAEMRRLLKAIEDWDNYLEVATNELDLEEDPERRAELLFDIGSVLMQYE